MGIGVAIWAPVCLHQIRMWLYMAGRLSIMYAQILSGDLVGVWPVLTLELLLTNSIFYTNVEFRANRAGDTAGQGGAIFLQNGIRTSRFYVVTITSNEAANGGGMCITNTDWCAEDLHLIDNRATDVGGGFISVKKSAALKHIRVTGNQAISDGGGMLIAAVSNFSIYGEDPFETNVYQNIIASNACNGSGGGAFITESDFALSHIHMVGNWADSAGGLYAEGGVSIASGLISNGVINGNIATNQNGGGLSVYDVDLVLEDVDITDNDAYAGDGAGIDAEGWGSVSIRARQRPIEISGNVGGQRGAAVFHNSEGTLFLGSVSTNMLMLMNNLAWGDGGALYVHSASNVIAGYVYFNNNHSLSNGGAIALRQDSHLQISPFTEIEPSFAYNHAEEKGGAIYAASTATSIIDRTAFYDNRAETDGGALYFSDGGLLVNKSQFVSNTSSNDGGAIALTSMSYARIIQADGPWYSYTNNYATRFENNVAGSRGGAIDIDVCQNVGISHAAIISNQANRAGGIYMQSSSVTVSNSILAYNSARATGGAGGLQIWSGDGVVHFCTIINNDEYGIMENLGALDVDGSIVWGHSSGQISSFGFSSVAYSCVEGGHSGIQNITNDPALYQNYHLKAYSPCIDRGGPVTRTDLDGEPSLFGSDIGSDECIDTDLDGLPNIVETGTGIWVDEVNTGTSWLNADTDGDTCSDGNEWIATTNPNDSNSVLQIKRMWRESGSNMVQWTGGLLANQYLEYTTDISSSNVVWVCVYTNTPITPVTNNMVLELPTNAVVIRIRASR